MSTTVDLVVALKNELKNAHMTYADLAKSLDMAESSVKRMLAKGDMPLTRVDAICRALKIDCQIRSASSSSADASFRPTARSGYVQTISVSIDGASFDRENPKTTQCRFRRIEQRSRVSARLF